MNRSPWFLLRFLKLHLITAGLSVIISSAVVLFGVGLIGTSAYLISFAALRPSIAMLQVSIIAVRFFGIGRSALRYLERLTSHSVNFQMLAGIRVWLYRALISKIPARDLSRSSGDLLTGVVEDVDTLEFFFIRVVNPPLCALISGLATALIFQGLHPRLAVSFIVCFFISFVVSVILAIWISKISNQDLIRKRAELKSVFVDFLEGLPELLLRQSTGVIVDQIRDRNEHYIRAQHRSAFGVGAVSAITVMLTGLSMYFMLVQGVFLVSDLELNGIWLAGTALITLSVYEVFNPVMLSANAYALSDQAVNRILQIAGSTSGINATPANFASQTDPVPPSIGQRALDKVNLSVEGVSFRYQPEERFSLDQINFSVDVGQKIAIVGGSGSGKSTLAKLIMGYWSPDQGRILLNDYDANTYPIETRRELIAYSAPDAYFFNRSIRENLLFANDSTTDDEILLCLDRCQLTEWYNQLPAGLDSLLGDRGQRFSVGERRRLDIARMMLRNPAILILDEPFSGLDADTAKSLMEAILNEPTARTLILVTHRLLGMHSMDDILVMEAGRIIERGTHKALIKRNGRYTEMWLAQSQLLLPDPI